MVGEHSAAWHEARVRISRPRLLLRIALLLSAAAFMAWRGQPLLALLALATALVAGLALRPRRREKLLKLGGLDGRSPGPPPGPPAQ
jgi:hypothetical protein